MKKTERNYKPITSFRHLISVLSERGEKTVFRYRQGGKSYDMSYENLAHRITATAAGLFVKGLSNKRIAVIGETSPEWISSYLAIVAGGGVVVPMDKELDISEIERFLSGIEAEAIVYSPSFHEKLSNARKTHPSLRTFIPMKAPDVAEENILPLENLIAEGENAIQNGYSLPERNPSDLAIMLFTSGTTGTSKCVMLCEKNLVSTVDAACEAVNFCPEDVTLSVLPLHHTYELAIMLSSLTYGFTVCLNDSLRHLAKNLAEYRPTGLVLVPLFVTTLYKKIFDNARKSGKEKLLLHLISLSNALRKIGIDIRPIVFRDVQSAFGGRLKKIICGGAPLSPEMVKAYDAFGIQICEGYGITECSPLISVNPYYDLRLHSVGPAVNSCQARIVPNGEKSEQGFEEGEIQVKGDNVMLGYYQNEEENAKAFSEDGWFRTGDVGYMDGDGYIYITGRMKSVIVLENGKNVFPEEIEEYLANISEISECVVIGRKNEETDTVDLTAVIFPNRDLFPADAGEDQIKAALLEKINALNRKLPSFKKIKNIELRESEFEKTTSKKIKRHLIK